MGHQGGSSLHLLPLDPYHRAEASTSDAAFDDLCWNNVCDCLFDQHVVVSAHQSQLVVGPGPQLLVLLDPGRQHHFRRVASIH